MYVCVCAWAMYGHQPTVTILCGFIFYCMFSFGYICLFLIFPKMKIYCLRNKKYSRG